MQESNNCQPALKKILKCWDSVAIIIAIVVGVGIFRVPAEVAKYLISPNLILLAWFCGGIISLLGALCYAELSASFPETGGNYIYLRESYGPGVGFLFAWTELLVIRPGSIAAVSFVGAEYLLSFLSLNADLIKPITVFIILCLSSINMLGLYFGKRTQNALIVTKILALLCIIVFGFLSKKGAILHFEPTPGRLNSGILSSFGLALIPILWTYGGWHENTFVAGETRNATKAVPLALILGVFIIIAFYLTINFLYIYLIPVEEIAKSSLIGSDVLQILFGRYGRKLFEVLIILSSLGCINAMIITGSRIAYAIARDNIIFRYIGEVNTKYATPARAIIINAVGSILLVIWGSFNKILFFTGISVWLFFALAIVGLFVLRYKFPNIERPYKVWGYPTVPLVFIFVCIALCINTAIFYPFQTFIGVCLMISGIPVYILSQKIYKKSLST